LRNARRQRHVGRQRDAVINIDAVGVDGGGPVAGRLQLQAEAVGCALFPPSAAVAPRAAAAALPTAKVPVSIGVFWPLTTEKLVVVMV
jgi:hypothetical protein